MADTGIRVPFKIGAPLAFLGMLSTAEHCDQCKFAMLVAYIPSTLSAAPHSRHHP
jgi:hypothetical protein